MHSAWIRANVVLTFAATVLAGLCVLATISDTLRYGKPEVFASIVKLETLQRERTEDQHYGRTSGAELSDRARLVVNLKADFTDDFSWNTKQIYLFLTVDYASRAKPVNQLTFWSKILHREDAVIDIPQLRGMYPYSVADQGHNLRGLPYNLTVAWNIMPYVGILQTRRKTFPGGIFPAQYLTTAEAQRRASNHQ